MSDYINKPSLLSGAEKFFAYSRERYQILLNRRAGKPREEWTQDPVLKQWSFCNIFREDDATTIWFRDNIRDPLRSQPEVILATIAFRWFNRINAGEVLKPFILERNWDFEQWRMALEERKRQDGVIITGAYIVKTPARLTKIEALLFLIEIAKKREEQLIKDIYYNLSLQAAWEIIMQLPYQGQFTAYEIVTDLRHTDVLGDAVDVNSWANPGPGCAAGLGELFYDGNRQRFDRGKEDDREYMITLMAALLDLSKEDEFWPHDWPEWEMREVEHTLCEYDKYRRAQQGLRLKRKYVNVR
jgi:hypothetical protein